MTELETQIWNTIHNWCNAQSNEIPDQNRRHLMDEIKELVLSHVNRRLNVYEYIWSKVFPNKELNYGDFYDWARENTNRYLELSLEYYGLNNL